MAFIPTDRLPLQRPSTRIWWRIAACLLLALFEPGCFIMVQSSEIWRYPGYHGWVLDAKTRAPLAGAHMTWKDRRQTAATDSAGGFLFQPKAVRKHFLGFESPSTTDTFLVERPGYKDRQITHTRLKYDDDENIDLGAIEMEPSLTGQSISDPLPRPETREAGTQGDPRTDAQRYLKS